MGCCMSVCGSFRPQKSSETVKSLWQEQHLQKHLRFSPSSLVPPAALGQVQIQQAEGKRGSDPSFLRSDTHSKLPHQCSEHGHLQKLSDLPCQGQVFAQGVLAHRGCLKDQWGPQVWLCKPAKHFRAWINQVLSSQAG